MAITRLSFKEYPGDYRRRVGFVCDLSLRYSEGEDSLVIESGGLVYGFDNGTDSYGWLVTSDEYLSFPKTGTSAYVTLSKAGFWNVVAGGSSLPSVRGIGANIEGVPWYTVGGNALVAKVYILNNVPTGFVVCDDAYFCEYEA
jgi:hypothetical protein